MRASTRFRVWRRTHTYVGNGEWEAGPWRDQGTECRDLSTDEETLVTESQVIRQVERFGSARPSCAATTPLPHHHPHTKHPSPAPPTISPTTGEPSTRTLVRQYIALRNYAFETGDVEPMLDLALST